MKSKLQFDGARVTNPQLSQGQRKRLALLLAVAEQRDICCWMNGPLIRIRSSGAFSIANCCRRCARRQTVFAISHDDHYFEHADRLLEMRSGHLRELTGSEREHASRDSVSRIG